MGFYVVLVYFYRKPIYTFVCEFQKKGPKP